MFHKKISIEFCCFKRKFCRVLNLLTLTRFTRTPQKLQKGRNESTQFSCFFCPVFSGFSRHWKLPFSGHLMLKPRLVALEILSPFQIHHIHNGNASLRPLKNLTFGETTCWIQQPTTCCWSLPRYQSSSPSITLPGSAGSSLSIIRSSSITFRNGHYWSDPFQAGTCCVSFFLQQFSSTAIGCWS